MLYRGALEEALEQVRALRVELVKEISQGTGTGAGVGFRGRRDSLALYKSKLIAMTFLYEVRFPPHLISGPLFHLPANAVTSPA